MTTSDSTVERGSGNVFADLGNPEADAHLLKAELVSRIDARRVAALGGDFREYSLERLFRSDIFRT